MLISPPVAVLWLALSVAVTGKVREKRRRVEMQKEEYESGVWRKRRAERGIILSGAVCRCCCFPAVFTTTTTTTTIAAAIPLPLIGNEAAFVLGRQIARRNRRDWIAQAQG